MKLKHWHIIALISCVLWLVYYPAISAPLNSVDDVWLANDLLNRDSFSWEDFWFPRSKSYFRPLVNSSFILDQLFWGFEDSFLHLENLLLHWLNLLLVYSLGKQVADFQGIDARPVAACAALFFGLHPINTEAVIWIAGRADLLATTFVLLSLLAMVFYLRRGSLLWLAWTVMAFFAGTLAKETAIFVLPGLLALGWVALKNKIPGASTPVKAWLPALGALLALTGYVVLRTLALRGGDLGVQHVVGVATGSEAILQPAQQLHAADPVQWMGTLQTLLKGVGFYARKLVQPFPLNFGIIDVADGYAWLGVLIVLLFIALIIRLNWWSAFVLTAMSLASVALLVALGDISWTPYAERYMYAPSAMLAIGLSLGGGQIVNRWSWVNWKPWLATLCGALVALCSWGVFQRTLVWQDNLTLFSDTVEKSPDFALAHNQLAQALLQRGQKDEALAILRQIEMPISQAAFLNKVLILIEDDKLDEARQFLLDNLTREETAAYHTVILERLTDVVRLQSSKSLSPAQKMRYNDEIISYLKLLWQRTGKPFYLYRLGNIQLENGDLDAAHESFVKAYNEFPPESIYKEPSRKLAEKLKSQ